MAYTENQLNSATGFVTGATRSQKDLEKADAAINEAMELCGEIAALEIKLIGYPNEVQAKTENTDMPVPEAALPRLGASASDLIRSVRRAAASLSRINGAL